MGPAEDVVPDLAGMRADTGLLGAVQRAAQAEIGIMLRLTPAAASTWWDLAMALVRRLLQRLATLEAGEISLPTVRVIAEESENLDVAQCAHLEAAVLPQACVSRVHHQIKQMPGWHCAQDDRGRLTWTTPTGLRFITRPPPEDGEEPPDMTPAPDPAEDLTPF